MKFSTLLCIAFLASPAAGQSVATAVATAENDCGHFTCQYDSECLVNGKQGLCVIPDVIEPISKKARRRLFGGTRAICPPGECIPVDPCLRTCRDYQILDKTKILSTNPLFMVDKSHTCPILTDLNTCFASTSTSACAGLPSSVETFRHLACDFPGGVCTSTDMTPSSPICNTATTCLADFLSYFEDTSINDAPTPTPMDMAAIIDLQIRAACNNCPCSPFHDSCTTEDLICPTAMAAKGVTPNDVCDMSVPFFQLVFPIIVASSEMIVPFSEQNFRDWTCHCGSGKFPQTAMCPDSNSEYQICRDLFLKTQSTTADVWTWENFNGGSLQYLCSTVPSPTAVTTAPAASPTSTSAPPTTSSTVPSPTAVTAPPAASPTTSSTVPSPTAVTAPPTTTV